MTQQREYAMRPSQFEDIAPVAKNMREADKQEVWDAYMTSPEKTLTKAYEKSEKCWTILVDGEPVGMFGVSRPTMLSSTGIPWLLGTDALVANSRSFLLPSKRCVEIMKIGYNVLENHVSVSNDISIRWLKWLGFTVEDEEILTVTGAKFKRFYMENK